MRIITHRGFWLAPEERNTKAAFQRAFEAGLGAEIDVRDLAGELVVSHDPPDDDAIRLTEVLALHAGAGQPGELAINVKADGLCDALRTTMSATPRWSAFDMSVPDTLHYRRAGAPYLARQSEHEPSPPLYAHAYGVWLDCFEREWFDEQLVRDHLDTGKSVTIVSPELHGRPHADAWQDWGRWRICDHPALAICTDHPLEAQAALG